jgi:hypothetical protein
MVTWVGMAQMEKVLGRRKLTLLAWGTGSRTEMQGETGTVECIRMHPGNAMRYYNYNL